LGMAAPGYSIPRGGVARNGVWEKSYALPSVCPVSKRRGP
jgi:hypothetical protein